MSNSKYDVNLITKKQTLYWLTHILLNSTLLLTTLRDVGTQYT